MKSYYSDYVAHCIRYYATEPQTFNSSIDQKDYAACDEVLKTYPQSDLRIILDVFSAKIAMTESVNQVAKANDIKTNRIWKLIEDTERKIAIRRGLL